LRWHRVFDLVIIAALVGAYRLTFAHRSER
jgi:hypothetical protein